jgi:polar amino acid transport system ATP-binding protein
VAERNSNTQVFVRYFCVLSVGVGEVLQAVRDLKEEGMTMLIATHEMSFAREVANQVAFLHEGRILERGPPSQVLTAPRREETRRFLGRLLEAGRA